MVAMPAAERVTVPDLNRMAGRFLALQRRQVTAQCVQCGAAFAGIALRRYCSKRCVKRAYRQRQRLIRAQAPEPVSRSRCQFCAAAFDVVGVTTRYADARYERPRLYCNGCGEPLTARQQRTRRDSVPVRRNQVGARA
jgi:hypothetical protein